MASLRFPFLAGTVALCILLLSSFFLKEKPTTALHFPYAQAGLSKREAAAHLISRFSYGSTPGQADFVVDQGLENWFEKQLDGDLPEDSLTKRLSVYDAINLSNAEVCMWYPKYGNVIKMAVLDSAISKDSVGRALNKKAYANDLDSYMTKKGYKYERDLYKQFINQNILRAVYANNQLHEVLTDFWFNHFNVSFTKNTASQFIPAYERDVMRPNVVGAFHTLLLATAKSPAMLYFLDNFSSADSVFVKKQKVLSKTDSSGMENTSPLASAKKKEKRRRISGLNENYAREVIELHTLGVDGGYTQKDVREAARILTGWTVFPISELGPGSYMKSEVAKVGLENLESKGYVRDGDFLFVPGRHDKGEKNFLGRHFEPGGGYSEGVELLTMLAHHPSTAKFISRKLATRFVCDQPPQSLVDKMAASFLKSGGDIRQVLITMVNSAEFWDKKYAREKIKSPFELAISSLRGIQANVLDPYPLYAWITRMGQKTYYYQAPTGFPDKGTYWINTGSLLNRMNFSMMLAFQKIGGINYEAIALTKGHEPGSPDEALVMYCKLLLPERNLEPVIKQLTPMINDPELADKLKVAVKKKAPPSTDSMMLQSPENEMSGMAAVDTSKSLMPAIPQKIVAKPNNPLLAQVIGIIIGSPEFQRR